MCLLALCWGQSAGCSAEADACKNPARRHVCLGSNMHCKAHSITVLTTSTKNRFSAVMYRQINKLCRAVSSRVLVPGDVVVLLAGTATCDIVLLRGNCLVEESSLSGEVGFSTNALFLHHVMSLTQQSTCLLCCRIHLTILQLHLEGTLVSHQASSYACFCCQCVAALVHCLLLWYCL